MRFVPTILLAVLVLAAVPGAGSAALADGAVVDAELGSSSATAVDAADSVSADVPPLTPGPSATLEAGALDADVPALAPGPSDTLEAAALDSFSPPPAMRVLAGVRVADVPGGLRDLADPGARVADAIGARAVGPGWPGFRSGAASNVMPASMTSLVLYGRAVDDWLWSGLDPLSAYSAGGAVVVASGHDLAAVPWVWGPGTSSVSPACGGSGCGPSVAFDQGWPLDERPYARLTMSGGSRAWKETGFEFERGALGGDAAVRGAYQEGSGRGPEPDSRHESEHASGVVVLGVADGWAARFGGVRGEVERRLPLDGDAWRAVQTVESHVSASLTDGRSNFELHHGSTWASSSLSSVGDGTATLELNGFTADVAVDARFFRRLTVFGEDRRASGSLLTSSRRARAYGGSAEWRVDAPGHWTVEGVLYVSVLGGDALPSVRAVASRLTAARDLVFGVGFGGRRPTLLETGAARIEISSGSAAIVSNPDLDAELALSCFAEGRDRSLPVEVGVRLEAARVFSPIVLEASAEPDTYSPANGEDGSSGSFTLWCERRGASGAGVKLSATGRLFDENGPMNALSPAASYEARLAGSLPTDLFDDYLHVVAGAALSHAGGLAVGPWADELDDTTTSISVSLSVSAGDATLYAVADDVLDAAASTLPGRSAAGRTLHAGFSWDFWD